MMCGIEQGFHRRPLAQKCLAHLVAQSSQRSKLRLQGQLVLAVEIFQPARSTGFLQRLRQLLRLHIPSFDLALFEQLSLGESFERTHERNHRCFRIVQAMQSPTGMGQQIVGLHIFYGSRVKDELFQESRIRFDGW